MKRCMTMLCLSVIALLAADAAVAQDAGPERKGKGRNRKERRRSREKEALKVGQLAPIFTLKSLDGKSETKLEEFRGSKPVILFFGSYT